MKPGGSVGVFRVLVPWRRKDSLSQNMNGNEAQENGPTFSMGW